jgi:hypothetical protein
MIRPRITLALLTILIAAPAHATPFTSVTVGAWSNQQTQNGTTSASLNVGESGAGGPGSANAGAAATTGTVEGQTSFSGCAIALPPDGQPCNGASASATFNDVVAILSDAPDGTPVQVQATFQVNGLLDGEGSFTYGSSGIVFSTGLAGANGGSGGVAMTSSNTPISASTSVPVSLTTGINCPIGASCSMNVGNPCCGPDQGRGMTLSLTGTLTLSAPTLPAGATFVHFIGSGGHDYGVATASVDATALAPEGLSPARPNPTLNSSGLELTLARARSLDVAVFDVAGRRVATLAHGVLEPGTHALVWDGHDDRGSAARGGMYVVRAMGEGLTATRRVVRLQ